jgi:hypothetical protein
MFGTLLLLQNKTKKSLQIGLLQVGANKFKIRKDQIQPAILLLIMARLIMLEEGEIMISHGLLLRRRRKRQRLM